MSLNLLDILKKHITEQGGKFKSMVDLQGKTAGDEYASISIGDDMKVIDVLSKGESEIYDDSTTYEEDALLGYHERAKKDRDDGITNPNLISDIIKALKIAGISAEIHYSREGHDKYTSTGNISRHWAGNAVDLSVIDGVGNKGGAGSNKGLCCPTSEKFMSGGDKIVDALETLGYKYGESGNVKGYLWRTDTGGNHWNHIHVSRTDRPPVDSTKPEDEEVPQKENITSGGKTVVFGGMDYATPEWMKSQWVAAGLPVEKAVFLAYTSTELSNVKKNNKIDKIVGFSAGGTDVWDEIISNSSDYTFMGLIDPSTSKYQFNKYKDGGLPSSVKSLSNSANWETYYPDIAKRLKALENKGYLTKTNSAHINIPLEFFKKYKSYLS